MATEEHTVDHPLVYTILEIVDSLVEDLTVEDSIPMSEVESRLKDGLSEMPGLDNQDLINNYITRIREQYERESINMDGEIHIFEVVAIENLPLFQYRKTG